MYRMAAFDLADIARPVLVAALLCLLCLLCGAALAQTPNLNYTDDMPSVERVKAEIQGSDPTDTLARQVAVFTYLSTYIQRIKYNRTVRGPYTPGEERLMGAYGLAGYQISQDYAKSHTAEEAKSFEGLHGRYEMNPDFYEDWSKRLIGKQGAAAYKSAENELAARQQAHVAQEQRDFERDRAAQQEADRQIFGGQQRLNDPGTVSTRRCMELGGNSVACVGKGFMSGLFNMVGFNPADLTGPGRAGVILNGNYRNPAALANLTFDTDTVSVQDCGKLVAEAHSYTIDKRPGVLQVVVQNEPRPIVLTMRPDGGLTGPGAIDVKGNIIIGYHTVTSTLYVNGQPAVGTECGAQACQTTTTVPDYAPKIERCAIGALAAPPRPKPVAAQATSDSGLVGMLTGFMGTLAPGSAEPGLRMTGQYGSGTLLLDFSESSVILDCGAAHARQPYRVENGADQLLIHVENSGGPFTLALQPDNSLRGSGSTIVNGRLVSGMRGDDVTFAPRSERCDVGNFRPKAGAVAATSVAAAPVAAGASGLRLAITSIFPARANPLAGHVVYLMKERIDNAMRRVGAPIPAGATPGKALQAWATACLPPNDCKSRTEALSQYYIGKATVDSTGRAILLAPVPPGSYFVFSSASVQGGIMVWDLRTDVKAANNAIVLEARNAEVLH